MKSADSSRRLDILIVVLAAMAVRVLHALGITAADPTFDYPIMDARWHLQWAMGISQGNFGHEIFFRAPLYPWFLGILIYLFGPKFLLIRIVQAVLGSVTAAMVCSMGHRLGGRAVGVVSGLGAALYGTLVYFDGELLIPTLYLPLLTSSIVLILIARERRRIYLWASAGFVMGMAALARPNVLVFVPVVVVWMAWELKGKACIKPAAALLIAFAIPVGAVTVRNGVVGGEYVLVASQGGINFYIGNNGEADGKTAVVPMYFPPQAGDYLYEDSISRSSRLYAQLRLGRKLSAGEISRYWFGQTFGYIGNYPGEWLRLMLKKAYFLANGYEIPSNREIYPVRNWSPVLKMLMSRNPIALPYGLLFPLAMAGMIIAAWGRSRGEIAGDVERSRSTHRLAALFLATYASTVVAFFVTARHRLPLVPFMIPYAALCLVCAFRAAWRRRVQSRRLWIAVALVFAVSFVVSNTRAMGVRADKKREFYIGLGEVYFQKGRYAEAAMEFQKAVLEDPRIDRAWFNLGVSYIQLKRYNEAMRALEKVLEINPRNAAAWSHIGNIYIHMGRPDLAEQSYRKAFEIDPKLAIAHYNLAVLLKNKGDMGGYERELAAAVDSDPYFKEANLDMAQLLIARGNVQDARKALQRVLRIDPTNEKANQLLKSISR